jgi:hypothetical protein
VARRYYKTQTGFKEINVLVEMLKNRRSTNQSGVASIQKCSEEITKKPPLPEMVFSKKNAFGLQQELIVQKIDLRKISKLRRQLNRLNN